MISVNKERLLSLFEHLAGIDSPSGAERAVCDLLKAELAKIGVTAQEDTAGEQIGGTAGNLYAYISGELDLPPILFCAHMDTVSPCRDKKILFETDGTIHSGGDTVLGADDFAGISAILEALSLIRENDVAHRPIELLFSVAEETYCKGVSVFDFSTVKAKEAYVFDLDGAVGTAAYAAPTILSFQSEFCGKASHAGFAPERGVHAVKAAAYAVSQIPCGRSDADTTVNIGTIHGGTADNIVPEVCSLTGEIRSYSDAKATTQYDKIAGLFEHAAAKYGAEVKITLHRHITAYETDTEHSVTRRFLAVCNGLQRKPQLIRSFGGSDNNVLAQNGITGLVAATAMHDCHTTSEWTTASELKQAAELAFGLMTSQL